jgi:hypothetical protein
MQSLTPFDYFISVTGDCSNNGSGAASIFLSGGTPPYTVEWVEPDLGADVIESEPSVRTGLTAQAYGVRVNDTTLPFNLEFYINIPISSGVCVEIDNVQSTTCNLDNGSVTGSSTSNFSSTEFYLFTSNDIYLASGVTNTNQIVFQSLSAGTYYLTTADLGGCTGKSSNFIIENSNPFDYGLYVLPNSSCGGNPIGKITVTGQTGTPPYSYLWSNGQTGSTITGLTQGTYSVSVTDSFGCVLSKNGTVTDIDPIGFGLFTAIPPSCFSNDGSITLTITGGTAPYYYSASTGNVEISYGQTFTISNLFAGQYNFLVTDAGLCSINVGTTLLAPSGITSANIVGNNSFCSNNGGSISISVTDGQSPYTYSIVNSTGGTTSVTTILSNYTFTNLFADTYDVTLQDSTGCGLTQQITITTQASFNVTTQVTGTTCNANNGLIRVEKTSGGTTPFDYILDDTVSFLDTAASAVTFNNVSSGSHNIKVIDATGCTQSFEVFVPTSSGLNYSLYKTSCGLGSGGTITTFISSGEPPFTFNWSSNVSGNPQDITVTGLTAGTYSVTVVDSNGCSLTRSTNVTCDSTYSSFQTYVMGTETFIIQPANKFGIIQMLNEGFFDLTSGNTGCHLITAEFVANVSITPSGLTLQNSFYTGTTLTDVPTDSLWFATIKNLVETIDGVSGVIIDQNNNQIKIETNKDSPLNGQEISVELIIVYDIMCLT